MFIAFDAATTVNILGAAASWAAAVTALAAIFRSRHEYRLRNTFEMFKEVHSRLVPLRGINIKEAKTQVLDCYSAKKRVPEASPGELLLSFLDTLEFLAFFAFSGAADLKLTVKHLRSTLTRVVDAEYIEKMQLTYGRGGKDVYCELHEILLLVEGENPAFYRRVYELPSD